MSSQLQTLRTTISQQSDKNKIRIKELKQKNSDSDQLIKQKTLDLTKMDDAHRKSIKQFQKEQSTWNEKADRFESDRNKWRNYFQQATKEMKTLKKENRKNRKILEKIEMKEKEESALEDEKVKT